MTTLLIVEIVGSSDVGEDQYASVHLTLDLPVVPQIGSSLRLQYVEKPEHVDQAFGMADLAGVHPSALFLIEEVTFCSRRPFY
jgi:hypothetical protein